MAKCIIDECENDATGRMRTCALCRASMHRWEKRRPAEILERSQKLNLWRGRMSQFAVVKDEQVELRTHDQLQRAGIMEFRDAQSSKRKKAPVVQLQKYKARKRA